VYTPHNVDDTSNLPVMVFFHGGNFDKGMPNVWIRLPLVLGANSFSMD